MFVFVVCAVMGGGLKSPLASARPFRTLTAHQKSCKNSGYLGYNSYLVDLLRHEDRKILLLYDSSKRICFSSHAELAEYAETCRTQAWPRFVPLQMKQSNPECQLVVWIASCLAMTRSVNQFP